MILKAENYFSKDANWAYMSASQFKSFDRCPAAAMNELKNGQEFKTAFLEGHLFEALICGDGEQFLQDHPETHTKKGDLYANFQRVKDSAEAFMKQDMFSKIVNTCEKQVILTGEIAGIPFKGALDFFDPITGNEYDSKCIKNTAKVWSPVDKAYIQWHFAYGYHFQAAIYRELIRQNYGKDGDCYLLVATKETVPDVFGLQYGSEVLDNALEIIENYAPKYMQIKMGHKEAHRCEECDYCRKTKIIKSFEKVEDYN